MDAGLFEHLQRDDFVVPGGALRTAGVLCSGMTENVSKVLMVKSVDPDGAFYELLTHVCKQVAAMWANFSLLFQFWGIRVEMADLHRFTFCGIMWGLSVGVESAFKFILADAFAKWACNRVYQGDRLVEERPVPPRGLERNALFTMFSKKMNRNLRTSAFPFMRNEQSRWQFYFSVLQAKKGTYPLADWDIDAELRKTFGLLTTEQTFDVRLDPLITSSIFQTVEEVLRRPASEKYRPLFPSVSASEGRTRRSGGAATDVSETLGWAHWDGKFVQNTTPVTFDFIENKRVDFTDIPQDLLRNLWDLRSRDPTATVHEVLEAFKLRVITTGPAIDYYLMKYINRQVHSQVMRHPFFCFTSGPVDSQGSNVDVEKLHDLVLFVGEVLESVDYKAATDNEKARYVRFAWYAVCIVMGYGYEVYEWGSISLTQTILRCKLRSGEVLVGQQANGQLMGHLLSFPLLCLVNAAILRLVYQTSKHGYLPQPLRYEDSGRAVELVLKRPRQFRGDGTEVKPRARVALGISRLKLIPLTLVRGKVNGDDGLVVIDPRKRYILERLTSAVGFTLSVGKSYSSTEFGMINSRIFLLKSDEIFGIRRPYCLVPYLNLGLIKGTGRVLSDTRKDDVCSAVEFYSDCGTKASKLIDGFSPDDQKVAMSMFIGWNREALSRTQRDWYLPRNMGGLELPCTLAQLPPLSTHAAIVASYAQSVGGISIDPTEVSCVASTAYRSKIPHILVDRAELPPDVEPRDDTVFFWQAGIRTRSSVKTSEDKFWQLHRKALNEKVAPLKHRVQRRWVSIPSVVLLQPALPLPFFSSFGDIVPDLS